MRDPQCIIQLDRQGLPFGYVVLDSLVNMTSSGGVRIYPDMVLDEAKMLAREMTLKFSFIGLPRGGGKSGMRVPAEATHEEKLALCEEFGRRLGPVIHKGLYYPGMDMNCGPDELRAIYRGAGITLGKITDTSFFTAVSVANALFAVREQARPDRPLTVAIEGFGSVGAYLAERLPEDQFRIVAFSTVQGAVGNPAGFSHRGIVELRKQHGDGLVSQLPDAENIEREAVLTADVDILVPAARVLSINAGNMASVRARWVVPVANAPFTPEAVDFLHAKGIVCLPGFVTNSGGVFASGLFDSGIAVARVEEIGATSYRRVIATLLSESLRRGQSPVRLAEQVALKRHAEALLVVSGRGDRLLRQLTRRGLIPGSVASKRADRQFVANLERLERMIREWSK